METVPGDKARQQAIRLLDAYEHWESWDAAYLGASTWQGHGCECLLRTFPHLRLFCVDPSLHRTDVLDEFVATVRGWKDRAIICAVPTIPAAFRSPPTELSCVLIESHRYAGKSLDVILAAWWHHIAAGGFLGLINTEEDAQHLHSMLNLADWVNPQTDNPLEQNHKDGLVWVSKR